MMNTDFFKEKSYHYKSKSGSLYFFTKDGVYRYANHWGRVANCKWKISGIENYKNQYYYVGYANWEDFFYVENNEKVFYLEFNPLINKVKILREKDVKNTSHFLMTLNFAFKRQKQIKGLFKNYKWALYYSESIEIVQAYLVGELINSDKDLQILKQNLKNYFQTTCT